jgi:predicted ATPase
MDRLIVKNFGPLKDIDIKLNKINLFIGENGSGKSVLGKLVTILKDPMSNINTFKNYNIDYLNNDTYIKYTANDKSYFKEFDGFSHSTNSVTLGSDSSSQYIPAERNLISLFNKYVTTFITADIPLPKFLLNFSSQYVRAREEIRELDLLNVKYKFQSDQERIFYSDKEYLLLEQSSSGIQSALPLYLTVKYFAKKHKSIIIEEPEQNLFPKAQTETIQYIIEQVSSTNNLFLMTHSPYVLSALNTLMMAYKAGNLGEEANKEVSKLFKEEQWINPSDFSAYYLENGIARDIKGRTGLISENEIDDISDEMACDFEDLLELYSEYSDDK